MNLKDLEDLDLDYSRSLKDFILDKISSIKDFSKSFIIGIKNFWIFRQEIYNYRWWDYGFDISLLRRSFLQKDKNWVKNTHYIGDKKDHKDIKIILECMNRIQSGEYSPKQEKFFEDLLINKFKRKLLNLWD